MDRRLFSTNFFVYKYYSPELDVYYIGSHHCKDRGWGRGTCSETHCGYKSSSSQVARLRKERPRATWEMLILGWAQDEDSLIAMELSWIRWSIKDPKCLNKLIHSSKRRAAGTGRRKFVRMIDPRGCEQSPRPEHFMELLAAGWRLNQKTNCVVIRNDTLRLECVITRSTLRRNIQKVLGTDWAYGTCWDYDRISVGHFLELLELTDAVGELEVTDTVGELDAGPPPPPETPDTEWPFFLEPY